VRKKQPDASETAAEFRQMRKGGKELGARRPGEGRVAKNGGVPAAGLAYNEHLLLALQ